MPPRTIEWIGDSDGFVRLIDQTRLPCTLAYRDCRTVEEVWEAIRSLRVRGAPAIGVAAAMGVVVGVQMCHDATCYAERLREVRDSENNNYPRRASSWPGMSTNQSSRSGSRWTSFSTKSISFRDRRIPLG